MRRIYLAGPDIFLPDAPAIGARKRELCAAYGFTGLYPLDTEPPARPARPDTASAIYRSNLALMTDADAIIANLTPFRGPSADAGTVFELGWMTGRGKPAFGYSTARQDFRTRTADFVGGATHQAGRWFDAAGVEIEEFGLHDNLMIDRALHLAGTPILGDFEACLVAARAYFAEKG